MESIYVAEFSKNAMKEKSYPVHIDTLDRAVKNNRKSAAQWRDQPFNDWQIVFYGSHEECSNFGRRLFDAIALEEELHEKQRV